jgi:short-subunit dehydrogenase
MNLSNSEKIRLKTKYGSWAIITGATSGIGLELTIQLAKSDFNILINSRHPEKLNEIEKSLKTFASIEIKKVAADVSEPEGIAKIIEASEGLNVGLLIVSAGYATSGNFIDHDIKTELNMFKVNAEALLILTHHFSRQFARQKRGGIILMSSIVAFQGTPYATHYSATKAYVQNLAEGLAMELKSVGVDVLAAAPGPVNTGFGARADMKMLMSMTPSAVAIPILRALGRRITVYPGYLTKLMSYSLWLVPRWAKIKILGLFMKGMTAHQRKSAAV